MQEVSSHYKSRLPSVWGGVLMACSMRLILGADRPGGRAVQIEARTTRGHRPVILGARGPEAQRVRGGLPLDTQIGQLVVDAAGERPRRVVVEHLRCQLRIRARASRRCSCRSPMRRRWARRDAGW